MKTLIAILVLSFSTLAFTQEVETIITGQQAEQIFNELNAYEYSAAAKTAAIEYYLVVRHNDKINCQKETTIYKYANETEVEYTCTLKN